MRAILAVGVFGFVASSSYAQGSTFDVASAKPSQRTVGKDAANQFVINGAGFSARNATLKGLIVEAYQVQPYQVLGGPNWLDLSEYDVEAKADGPATRERVLLMLQTLLTERFRLSLHKESKELRVYELVTGKSGPKIYPVEDTGNSAAKAGAGDVRSFQGDLQQFANLLAVQLTIPVVDNPSIPGRASGPLVPVLNKTGLKGIYNINVDMKPAAGADMFTLWQQVLQDQLGLKLESRKAAMEVLMVDNAGRVPISN